MAMTSEVARAGAELVPMRGDKEHHAAGEKDGAENEPGDAQPLEAGGTRGGRDGRLRSALHGVLRFLRANAGGGLRVEDAGRLPAI